MGRNGRWATALGAFVATPVPLSSRQEEDRYWCEPMDAGAGGLAWRAGIHEIEQLGCDEDWVEVAWCRVDPRSGH